MTVRQRSELSKVLGSGSHVKAIWARSKVVGELMIQVESGKKVETVFLPSSRTVDRPVNLLAYATPLEWKQSVSFLSAVRLGHLSVTVDS